MDGRDDGLAARFNGLDHNGQLRILKWSAEFTQIGPGNKRPPTTDDDGGDQCLVLAQGVDRPKNPLTDIDRSGIYGWVVNDDHKDITVPFKNNLGSRGNLIHHSNPISSGTAANRSASRPKSATLKIGASGSLLIATITLESFMPAKCWIAPEMPAAMYS